MSPLGESKNVPPRCGSRTASSRGLRSPLAAILLVLSLAGCLGGGAPEPSAPGDPRPALEVLDAQRGQLLYEAQCVSCHTTQAHWRDNSIVGSWSDVLAQVQRWQDNTGQQWSPAQVGDVAAYLNAVYYKMPCPRPGCQGKSTAAFTPGLGADHSRDVAPPAAASGWPQS